MRTLLIDNYDHIQPLSSGGRGQRQRDALGFFSANGAADPSVVIRTLVASPEGVTMGAGGAIVEGSDPEAELEETVGGTLESSRGLAVAHR